jgi:predicted MFS family arabinose efflux permease
MMCAGGFLGQLVPTLASFGHDPAFGIMLLTSLWPTGIIGNWLGGVADNNFGTRTASIIFVCFEIAACIGLIMAGSNSVVATLCTGTFMAAMSAFSNVTVSMVTNVFGRQDFENAWPVVSVPFKIIESFGVLLISMIAARSSFSGSYVAMIVLLIVAIVLMLMTTTKQIGSQIHEEKTASAYFE